MTGKQIDVARRHLRKADEVMREIIRRVGPVKLRLERNRFAMLVRSIISQQISTSAARSIRQRLEDLLAPGSITPGDIVTLDRVLCCYPDVTAMVASSTALAGTFYGVVYPRKSLVSKLVVRAGNLNLKLKKNLFRVFIHDPERVDALIREAGFEPRYVGKTLVWHVVLYERANAVRQGSPMAEAAEAA